MTSALMGDRVPEKQMKEVELHDFFSTVSELYLGTRLQPNVPRVVHCWADSTFLGGNLVPIYASV